MPHSNPVYLMRRITLLLAAAITLGDSPAASAQYDRELSSKPQPPRAGTTGRGWYYGTVTELTKDSITVTFGKEKHELFPLSDILRSGGFAKWESPVPGWPSFSVMPSQMYRLKDVKTGDMVSIEYSAIAGAITCDNIRITKRPGGRVPPLPDEAEKLRNPLELLKARFPNDWERKKDRYKAFVYIPYHEEMNAYWDLEDKGIPYPEKFGDKRRFPVAPMPRKKVLESPPISP